MNGIYQSTADCHEDSCWRAQIRLLATVMCVFVLPSVAVWGWTLRPAASHSNKQKQATKPINDDRTSSAQVPVKAKPASNEAEVAALLTRDSHPSDGKQWDTESVDRVVHSGGGESPLSSAESTVVAMAGGGGLVAVGSAPAAMQDLVSRHNAPQSHHITSNALTSSLGPALDSSAPALSALPPPTAPLHITTSATASSRARGSVGGAPISSSYSDPNSTILALARSKSAQNTSQRSLQVSGSISQPPLALRRQLSSPKHMEQQVTLVESLEVLKEPYFAVVFFAFFSGVAAGTSRCAAINHEQIS
jgi:hypothetical protein